MWLFRPTLLYTHKIHKCILKESAYSLIIHLLNFSNEPFVVFDLLLTPLCSTYLHHNKNNCVRTIVNYLLLFTTVNDMHYNTDRYTSIYLACHSTIISLKKKCWLCI